MSTQDSVAKVTQAIVDLQRTTVPLFRELITVLQSSSTQINGINRDLLQVVNKNLDNVSAAASRLAAAGTQLASDLVERAVPVRDAATDAPRKTPTSGAAAAGSTGRARKRAASKTSRRGASRRRAR
ncbi:MAG: hypothetical protein ACRD26_11755 [Vicinamibacterales bacterium]